MPEPIRTVFHTSDPQEATEAVRAALGGGGFTGVGERLPFSQSVTSYRGLVEGRMLIGARSAAHLQDGYEDPFLVVVRSGAMSVRQAGRPRDVVVLRAGDAMLMTPRMTTDSELDSPDLDFYQFGGGALEGAAPELAAGGRLDFASTTPRSADAALLLRRTAGELRAILASDDLSARPALVDSALRHFAVVTLDAFGARPPVARRHRGERVVRRAAAYIDEHLGDPLTVGDVAAAAGVSIRTLQDMFRAARDESPSSYLRRARLDAVRRALTVADPTRKTVAGIAADHGFAHSGRFAALYREEFGEAPSQALRR
ncbi:helix-turn-helix transcriptional regulator [Microbacterium sp. NPDC091313]